MHAFILAGGFATRLWPLTESRAKPLLPLAGQPMISHLTAKIPRSIPITVSTNAAFADAFEEWKKTQERTNITILIEQTVHDDQKLGALGAVAQWIQTHNILEDVLLLTGDNYCGFSMNDFLAHAKPGTALLAAHDVGNTNIAKAFGTVLLDEQGNIHGFEEKPAEPKTTLVSTGCSVLPGEILPIVCEYAAKNPDNVGGIFEELLQRNLNIHCYRFHEPWFDVGSFDAYIAATKELVGTHHLIKETSTVQNCTLKGAVVIGENCHITDCTLQNVVLFDNCILENCIIEDCVLDTHCQLQGVDITKKMLRAYTSLQANL